MEDKREPDKSSDENARGILSRIANTPGATLEDIGRGEFSLREGEDRDKTIAAVREEIVRIMQSSIPRRAEECVEYTEAEKVLNEIKKTYESLPEKDRCLGGKIISWEEIKDAIPDMQDFISGINTLVEPRVYFINQKGQLIIGDGCCEPPSETLGRGYFALRKAATRISYIDNKGEIVTVKNRQEIPYDAKIISEKGLITEEEEDRVNHGQFDNQNEVWLERGDDPASVRCAKYRTNGINFEINIPQSKRNYVGSRCVFRVNLDFDKAPTELDKKN